MQKAIVQVQHLRKVYGEVTAEDGISFEVYEGGNCSGKLLNGTKIVWQSPFISVHLCSSLVTAQARSLRVCICEQG